LNRVRALAGVKSLADFMPQLVGDFGAVDVDGLRPAAGRHDAAFERRCAGHVALELLGVLRRILGRRFGVALRAREGRREDERGRQRDGEHEARARHAPSIARAQNPT
jgi:hypothetical protein